MTTLELAAQWAAPEHRVRRWCAMRLLPATKTGRGWRIEHDARPPFRDGPMITGEFTWSLTNGLFVIDNSEFGAEVGAGGRLLFWGGQGVGGGNDGSWSQLAIGVKLPPQ